MQLLKLLWIFLISMVPVIELRGAVILAAAENLPWWQTYIVATVGNILPVPFILLLLPWALKVMARVKFLRGFAAWLEDKAERTRRKIFAREIGNIEAEKRIFTADFFALMVFVMIPCPGTGAWTGSLVASFVGMPKRRAVIAVAVGVLICGVIMTLAAYGVAGFLRFLL